MSEQFFILESHKLNELDKAMKKRPMHIGQVIRYFRKTYGVTQPILSEWSGVSVPTIASLEKGNTSTSFDNVMKILSVLGVQIHFTMGVKIDYDSELGQFIHSKSKPLNK
jgi:transcriptional regulator with XRE-family HTH domain